jgi:hypothetical protein
LSSPCTHSRTTNGKKSPETGRENIAANQPASTSGLFPGAQDDAALVRSLLAESIRTSGKSRAQLAEDMSYFAGRKVTERMLNNWTASSRTDYPFPLDLSRPFCTATGNDALLKAIPERLGLCVIEAKDAPLIELGRAFLQRTHADQQIATLQSQLSGGAR